MERRGILTTDKVIGLGPSTYSQVTKADQPPCRRAPKCKEAPCWHKDLFREPKWALLTTKREITTCHGFVSSSAESNALHSSALTVKRYHTSLDLFIQLRAKREILSAFIYVRSTSSSSPPSAPPSSEMLRFTFTSMLVFHGSSLDIRSYS